MPKKVEQYENERKDVLNRMLEILGITDENKVICLNDVDNDSKKIERINELETDIKKYFLTSKWAAFRKPLKRKYYSILKNILKACNINYSERSETFLKKTGNKTCHTQKYISIEF